MITSLRLVRNVYLQVWETDWHKRLTSSTLPLTSVSQTDSATLPRSLNISSGVEPCSSARKPSKSPLQTGVQSRLAVLTFWVCGAKLHGRGGMLLTPAAGMRWAATLGDFSFQAILGKLVRVRSKIQITE
jgi:hypothetical protein